MAKEKFAKKTEGAVAELIDHGYILNGEIKTREAELKTIKETLRLEGENAFLEAPAGTSTVELAGNESTAKVTFSDGEMVVDQTKVELLKEQLGEDFARCFKTEVKVADRKLLTVLLTKVNVGDAISIKPATPKVSF